MEIPHAQIRRVSPRIIPPLAMIQYMIPNPTVPSQSHRCQSHILAIFLSTPKDVRGQMSMEIIGDDKQNRPGEKIALLFDHRHGREIRMEGRQKEGKRKVTILYREKKRKRQKGKIPSKYTHAETAPGAPNKLRRDQKGI